MTKIPKIFFQTSKEDSPQYIIEMIKPNIGGWEYIHFNDDLVIEFFKQNRVHDFPNIIDKFHSIPVGATKADSFRYYFLYVHGGVFMDSDAMLLVNINQIVKDYSYFSVNAVFHEHEEEQKPCIFQGFIGCTPKHPIVERALIDLYQAPVEDIIQDFHRQPKLMYDFYHSNNSEDKVLYEERIEGDGYSRVYDGEKEILRHYYLDKTIPNVIS